MAGTFQYMSPEQIKGKEATPSNPWDNRLHRVTALLWYEVELWRTMNVAKTSRTQMLAVPFPLGG